MSHSFRHTGMKKALVAALSLGAALGPFSFAVLGQGSGMRLGAAPVALAADQALMDDVQGQINDLNNSVVQKRKTLETLQKKEDSFRQAIASKAAESASLADEIGLLENRIAKSKLDIDIAKDEVTGLELEIEQIEKQVVMKEADVARQRALLGDLARKLYQAGFRRSALEILLSHNSISDYFDDLRRITELQAGVNKALEGVQRARAALETDRAAREQKKAGVEVRKAAMEEAQRALQDQVTVKDNLLVETKSSELQYRYLLADLKREQSRADADIQSLEASLRDKKSLADRLKGQDSVLSWPVPPTRGISTRFHDPEYPFRNVYEHPGLDIRAYQSTPVRASAPGVVARAKDAGMGYSYIMILHNGGISTVYGHISKIYAKEDAFVERGEIIGLSGGKPGTPGAGKMTTGPHLHYETRLNGIPVDPMKFLVSF